MACLRFQQRFAHDGAFVAKAVLAFEALLVNTVPGARLLLLFASPGIGWAVLAIGSIVVMGAPHARALTCNRD